MTVGPGSGHGRGARSAREFFEALDPREFLDAAVEAHLVSADAEDVVDGDRDELVVDAEEILGGGGEVHDEVAGVPAARVLADVHDRAYRDIVPVDDGLLLKHESGERILGHDCHHQETDELSYRPTGE